MSYINFTKREINVKIVYQGPGLSGKTTNIQYIHNKTSPETRGKLISLATDTERTLSFDFLPLSIGELPGGFKVRFHLYTVPGPVFYDSSRRLVLKGVDGIIFVADSQRARLEANLEFLEGTFSSLEAQGTGISTLPFVLQYNKQDLPGALPPEELDLALRVREAWPRFPASARQGVGVFDSLKAVSKLIMKEIRGDKS